STTTAPTNPLAFPRDIFAALAPTNFLTTHLSSSSTSAHPLRANHRSASTPRAPQIHTGSLTHAHGSAVVRLGNTVAVCGVRGEILVSDSDEPISNTARTEEYVENESEDDEVEKLGLLVPNFEINTGSTPSLIPGLAPSAFAQTLTARTRDLLGSTRMIRAADLRITYSKSTTENVGEEAEEEEEQETVVKARWVLYIDTVFLSIDGNAFDCAWLGILSALRSAKLPYAYFDEEYEGILCSDDPKEARALRLRGCPVPSTFAVFEGQGDEKGRWWMVDPDAFEESVTRESVCVVVDGEEGGKTVIKRVEKSGGGAVDRGVLKEMVERARERWSVWKGLIEG
ncbi:hypothetical protein M011DRAFT_384794, partial [Sporormia fimetaria CBS 119925]